MFRRDTDVCCVVHWQAQRRAGCHPYVYDLRAGDVAVLRPHVRNTRPPGYTPRGGSNLNSQSGISQYGPADKHTIPTVLGLCAGPLLMVTRAPFLQIPRLRQVLREIAFGEISRINSSSSWWTSQPGLSSRLMSAIHEEERYSVTRFAYNVYASGSYGGTSFPDTMASAAPSSMCLPDPLRSDGRIEARHHRPCGEYMHALVTAAFVCSFRESALLRRITIVP